MLSPPDKSPSSLSPLSSRFAAEAERENIRRLKQECRGLSTALKSLKRNSKEWVMIKSNLEIASEELACMLEDRNLFRSFTGGIIADLNVDKCLSLIPTPPLGRKEEAINQNDTAFPPFITTPPLVTKKHGTALGIGASDHDEFAKAMPEPPLAMANPNSSAESKEYGGTMERTENAEVLRDVQSREDPLDKAPKYSLEWFQIKMETEAAKQGRNSLTIPNSPLHARPVPLISSAPESHQLCGSSQSPTMLRKMTSLPEVSKAKTSRQGTADNDRSRSVPLTSRGFLPEQHKNSNFKLDDRALSDKLKTVPKYSLEWFTMKKDIIAATRIISDDKNDFEQARKSSQDEQMQQHQLQPSEKIQYAKATKKIITACPPSRPKDSRIRRKKDAEQKVVSLTEQLNRLPKYSLDWFQIKQEIEVLKRETS